jgi:glycosyltransferase involved in cell wall biosynthesis
MNSMTILAPFKVVGDPKNPERFSSSIIINNLNKAAKKLGLYDENGAVVVYDCIGNNHGYNPNALIVCYELAFPNIIVENCRGKPIIAVSRDNLRFALENPYIQKGQQVDWIPLGVDSDEFKPITKTNLLDKFVVLSYTESLVRSGFEILVAAFGELWGGSKDHVLYIKDRNGTPEFQNWIQNKANYYNITLLYENNHLSSLEEELSVFRSADIHCYLNRSSTWSLPCLQGLALGVPTIAMSYSGPKEYIINEFTGLTIDYSEEKITPEVLTDLTNKGMRNFFFPQWAGYPTVPYWAKPSKLSVMNSLNRMENNSDLRNKLIINGRVMAESLSWENSAMQLARVLRRFSDEMPF